MTQPHLVNMQGVSKSFGGIHAVKGIDLTLDAGEVVAVLGHNGAGKSTLMKMLAGAYQRDLGDIQVHGQSVALSSPAEAHDLGIETIYQTLALADNLDASANLFLGREIAWRFGPFRVMDQARMRDQTAQVIARLNPHFDALDVPCRSLSGGQRQTIAIARALQFDARILIMDEPTAALGPHETAMVADLTRRLKSQGLGIFLISHDVHDVFDLADRFIVMKGGQEVGSGRISEVTKDEVLGMVIMGRCPAQIRPGPGASMLDEHGAQT
ncbi:ATP-binding cassette domain-containing protein [Oceaniglobus trochenteri]|uniref:ATP-binding cassette domain-containing protein n=1 Tax=Oceaniglobus trochenteri TaxID=2763260 RepID=UPI001D0003AD|nr:ATP-binding cassette domain-containing protein [Oceaniglobus trochenteri]